VTTTRELKDKLEAALGQELAVEAVQRPGFWRMPVASYNVGSWDDNSHTTYRSLILVTPNTCAITPLLDVSGWGLTGADGKSTFRLIDYTCLGSRPWPPPDTTLARPGYTLQPPISFVATPNSSAPCFLTTQHSFVNDQTDVEITVFAWDPNGAAAPDIGFDWRCRVVFEVPF
jgi:hypothetical protein